MTVPVRRIYVDMDDTLNSFTLYVLRRLGCNVGDFDYDQFPEVGYNIYTAYRLLQKVPTAPQVFETEAEFWAAAQEWRVSLHAPICREAQFILDSAASLVGRKNVFICTKPFCAKSAADKLVWIEKCFPQYANNYVLTKDKSVVARPDALLIDDSDANLEEFQRGGGGYMILVPRPWNSLRGVDTTTHLIRQFALHLTYKERHEAA